MQTPMHRRQQLDRQAVRQAQLARAFASFGRAVLLTSAAALILWQLPDLIRYHAAPFANCPTSALCPEGR